MNTAGLKGVASKAKSAVRGQHADGSSSDDEFFDQAGAAVSPRKMEGNQAGLGFASETVSQNVMRAEVFLFNSISAFLCTP